MEALRNHIQHSGLPIHGITYAYSRLSAAEGNYFEHTVIPVSAVQRFKLNDKFKKAILEELKRFGEKVDLRGAFREYVSCFLLLHDEVRSILRDLLARQREVYVKAIAEYCIDENGTRIAFSRLRRFNDDGTTDEEVELVADILEYLDSLHSRNCLVKPRVHKTYATNCLDAAPKGSFQKRKQI